MAELEPIIPELTRWLADQPKKMLIGGQWVESASGKTFETLNPADGQVLAQVYAADALDVDRAVKAARKAFDEEPFLPTSATTCASSRKRFLARWSPSRRSRTWTS